MAKIKFIILFFMALNLSATDIDIDEMVSNIKNKETIISELKSHLYEITTLIKTIILDINENSNDKEYIKEQGLALEGLDSKVCFLNKEISDKELELLRYKETLDVIEKINFMKDLNNRQCEFIKNNPNKSPIEFFRTLSEEELKFIIELEKFNISQAN